MLLFTLSVNTTLIGFEVLSLFNSLVCQPKLQRCSQHFLLVFSNKVRNLAPEFRSTENCCILIL